MAQENTDWQAYYQKQQGRAPRPLLLNVLEYFATEPAENSLQAIDLGCGDGTETAYLLAHGWHVLAVDDEPAAVAHLMAKIPPAQQAQLQTLIAPFENVVLPPTRLIYAGYSLPFCDPAEFGSFWHKINHSIVPGGRFAGQFFGVKDSWAENTNMTFHTEDQVRAMLEDFRLEFFHEQDEDGQASSGPKHWHVFTVIAVKK
jgi:trans-aconitate methyltransferase